MKHILYNLLKFKAKKLSLKWKNFNAVKRNHRIFLVQHCNKSCVHWVFVRTTHIRYPLVVVRSSFALKIF